MYYIRIVALSLVLCAVACKAFAFDLKKEYDEDPGIAFCTSQAEGIAVVETHASAGLEKAQEVFKAAQCGITPMRLQITYLALVHEVAVPDGKVYVYRASIRGTTMNFEVYALLPVKHDK